MQANNPVIVKPSPADAHEILVSFWMYLSYLKEKAMPLLEDNPWILRERVPENVSVHAGKPFLHAAIALQKLDLAKYGLAHGAPMEDRCSDGNTALQFLVSTSAIEQGTQVDEFLALAHDLIAAGANCDAINVRDHEPVWLQAMHLPTHLFERLIQGAASLDFMDANNMSGLARVMAYEDRADKVALLLKHGVDVNYIHPRSLASAPLAYALDAGNTAMADLLLAHGANIHLKTPVQRGFLHLAGSPEGVRWLTTKGVDIEAKDVFGKTPLLHVLQSLKTEWGFSNSFAQETYQGVAKAMMAAGANVHARDREETSLSAAEFITAHQEHMLDLHHMLLALTAREVATQTIQEISRMVP